MLNETLRSSALALTMAVASALAVAITPHRYLADEHGREKLSQLVPIAFGKWQIDQTIVPVPPSPDLQKALDETYDETLSLTYRRDDGERVMLSIAYGRNQHKGMNTHRPEICYPAQGFQVVQPARSGTVQFGSQAIPVTRLVASLASRNEPITYWLLVGEKITSFGYTQRSTTIRYGLSGFIPDGVLVRLSSIGNNNQAAFELQELFIRDMLAAMTAQNLPRLLGKSDSTIS